MVLSGLSAGTGYFYRVNSRDAAGNLAVATGSFTTTPSNLKSLQSGTVTLPAGAASISVTINGVDQTKTFLEFGTSFNDANPQYSHITGRISSNGTSVVFQRYGAAGSPAVTVKWYVAEFTSGVTVQRGSVAMPTAILNVTLPASVDLSKAFALVSYRNSGGQYDGNDFIRAKLTSGTNLELSAYGAPSSGTVE